jgi:hypothetical protein
MPLPSFLRFEKLPPRTTPVVFAFYMSAIMAMLMCLIIIAAESGVSSHYLSDLVQTYRIAMPAAFVCIMIVRPLVTKLVLRTVHSV